MPLPYLCNVNLRDENLRSYKKKITGPHGSKNFNRNATQERANYQLSTVNYQLSTINCQLSTVNYQKTMAIKVNARETELKFGKEATYHSAMIWKMKQIRRFLRHKKGTQIPWITQILLIDS